MRENVFFRMAVAAIVVFLPIMVYLTFEILLRRFGLYVTVAVLAVLVIIGLTCVIRC